MKDMLQATLLGLASLAMATAAPPAQAQASTPLRVGAARIDITPTLDHLPAPFTTIDSRVFLRAVAIESEGSRAILIIADVPTISAPVAQDIIARVAAEAKVPRERILLGTTHTHNVIRVDPNAVGIILPGSPEYVAQVTKAASAAVHQALAQMQPAKLGVGKGTAHLVGNRNMWSPAHGRYISDVDRTGTEPIDHSLGVVKFETLDGRPIAYLLNYAFEPVIAMAMKSAISGDVPGVAARLIEERSGGAPALFTIGAAGVPLYRAEDTPEPQRADHARQLMQSYGTILAEEALAVSRDLAMRSDGIVIGGAAKALVCPGKATSPFNLPDRCAYTADSKLPACNFKDRDTEPVKLEMGVIRIGDLALVQTDANITPALGEKLHRRSPLTQTWIVALTFGPLRFVVDDAAYGYDSYEATATTAKKGCAEQGYLNGVRDMMTQLDGQ
ncbi:MAG: hypothetical protein COC10_02650 [Sphingobium sp.]|nr:MAG: hypothetical protein COC10_02650 [Sphingobium sp.]